MKLSAMGFSMMVCAALATPSFAAGTSSFAACHKAFNDAKAAGTLKGQDYAAFKKAQCTKNAPSVPTTTTAEAEKKPVAQTQAPAVSGDVLFPQRVAPEFASLSAGKARMKTCLAQYNANKSTGRNGGLKWIQKGGGYYSVCNNRLKGAAQ